ncbi:hypothetical protein DEG02_009090 [Xanthomonas vasicola]|nr:hypothetical protein KWO_002485 [Xanthomonas vasicola pv. musacearum NCPPB 4379]RJL83368.1 hypothetical protein DEG03_011350 [Xanthomonas vasicola]RRJ41105.1 hypothetical protein EIM46_08970 [Xanthomonas vasicola pv. musacearum]RJL85819.1 hypothetical protein DEF98_011990 [Xanthomonas vasicola]RJL90423.1 hypothetical protein DEF95_010345 [Xanthomonas vasicola]
MNTHAVWSSRSTHHRARTKPARAPRKLQHADISGALNARRGGSRRAKTKQSAASQALDRQHTLHSYHHVEDG